MKIILTPKEYIKIVEKYLKNKTREDRVEEPLISFIDVETYRPITPVSPLILIETSFETAERVGLL